MRVLGISGYHDSSAALIEDGRILCYLKEERLSRLKRDEFPLSSTKNILENYEVDAIVSTSDYPSPRVFRDTFLPKFSKNVEIHDYTSNHHLSHASLAFYNSGFDECLVFVIDRNGSIHHNCLRESETVFKCSYPCSLETLHKNYYVFNTGSDADKFRVKAIRELSKEGFSFNADSLMNIVKVYETATTLIGQHPLENGKTMGLASYGRNTNQTELFHRGRPIDNLFIQDFFISDGMTSSLQLQHLDSMTGNITEDNYQFYADCAYHVQQQTQTQVAAFIKDWVVKTGIKNVCITGGYGLNVVSNGNLVKSFSDINFYFEPLSDDSGNSIGAAMHLYRKMTGDCNVYGLDHTFYHGLGLKNDLQNVGKTCTIRDIANLLSEGKSVGVFNGNAEAGPRALGNRSILFDARNRDAKSIINRIKNREWYRPFAGMILEEYFEDYFDTHGLKKSETMTVSFNSKKSHLIPGVVHIDNSCRVQTVSGKIPHIYNLLVEFFDITQCPVILNTSFNLAGEPLVDSQEDAIQCFNNSELNVLWFPEIGKCLVKEEE